MARKAQIADKYDHSRTLMALILTEEEATAPRCTRSPRKAKAKAKKDVAGPPRRLEARPEGYAISQHCIIEPWILMDSPSIKSALKHVRSKWHVFVPDSQIFEDWFIVCYEGQWIKFMMLEERVHSRKMRGAMGVRREYPGLREVPCDACMWWTESKDLRPYLVGTSSSTVQEFRICKKCVAERVIDNTKGAGYVVRSPSR